MSDICTKFTIKLVFPKYTHKDYSSTILLCRGIPNFIEAKGNRKLNQLEINEENILRYYHKFLFISNIVLKFEGSKLLFNNKKISTEFLKEIYVKQCNLEMNKIEEKTNKVDINQKKKEENVTLKEKETYEDKIGKILNDVGETKTTEERKRNIPNVKFDDIGGIDNIIQEIRESIELPLKAPQIFKHLGIKTHKGILLYGEPGCGKTLIAKAIANEINAHFISVKASELVSMWNGESETNLRKIFEEANKRQPSIIYFDEIDSVGRQRTSEESGRFDGRFLTQLLTLMDGVEDYGDICVIGSTNRIDILDSALLRKGRFDLKIEVKKPDLKGCLDIFNKVTKEMPISNSLNKVTFSKKLLGYTGADIAFVAKEAGYNCIRRNVDIQKILQESEDINYDNFTINEDDFHRALNKLIKNTVVHN